jgi:hypothetical protein
MKYLLTVLCTLLCGIVGCEEQQMTVWGITGQDTDLTARVGVLENNVEIGATAKYGVASEIEFGPVPDRWGPYLLFHLTQVATIEDTPEPSPLQPFLEALHARPYAGVELVTNDELNDVQPNWIAGSTFTLSEDGNIGLVVEYLDGDSQSGDTHIGIVGRF